VSVKLDWVRVCQLRLQIHSNNVPTESHYNFSTTVYVTPKMMQIVAVYPQAELTDTLPLGLGQQQDIMIF
jgi:hypothetical protein